MIKYKSAFFMPFKLLKTVVESPDLVPRNSLNNTLPYFYEPCYYYSLLFPDAFEAHSIWLEVPRHLKNLVYIDVKEFFPDEINWSK